jgi:hypothetical protein
VLIRALVAEARSQTAIVNVPTIRPSDLAPGALQLHALRVEVPISELFGPPSSDTACEVVQLLNQRIDALHDIGLRLQAELYELGGHAGNR